MFLFCKIFCFDNIEKVHLIKIFVHIKSTLKEMNVHLIC